MRLRLPPLTFDFLERREDCLPAPGPEFQTTDLSETSVRCGSPWPEMAWLNMHRRAGPSTAPRGAPQTDDPPAFIQIPSPQNPVGLEQMISPKQIHAPQRVLCVAEQREPGKDHGADSSGDTLLPSTRPEQPRPCPALDPKTLATAGNLGTAQMRVLMPLKFNDGLDHVGPGLLGPGLVVPAPGSKPLEFEFCKRSRAAQESKGLNDDGQVHHST